MNTTSYIHNLVSLVTYTQQKNQNTQKNCPINNFVLHFVFTIIVVGNWSTARTQLYGYF